MPKMKSVAETYPEIQSMIDNGENQAAVAALEQLLSDQPDFGLGYHDLGALYLESGEKEKAGTAFRKAVECQPQNNIFLKSLGDYYHVSLEDPDKALEVYQTMIENGLHHADTFFIAANLSLVAQRFEQAIDYYEKVLEIEPWHAEAFDYLERVKAHLNRNASESQAASAEELYEKATVLGTQGKDAEAQAVLEKVIAVDPENALAHNDLGVYYHRLGNADKSLEHYQTATRLDPFNTTFQKNLADCLCFVKGDVVGALTIYLRLLKEDPEDVEVLTAAGRISQAIGRPADAEVFYGRAIEIEPWNVAVGEKLDELQNSRQQQSPAS
jgi:tetratricopeptide (TPR) repeat protein